MDLVEDDIPAGEALTVSQIVLLLEAKVAPARIDLLIRKRQVILEDIGADSLRLQTAGAPRAIIGAAVANAKLK